LITDANIMENESRRRILALAKEFPGIHFSRIKEILNLSPRTIRDQIYVLISFEQIEMVRVDGKKVYLVPDDKILTTSKSISLLSLRVFLQHNDSEKIFRVLLSNPGVSFTDIVGIIQQPRSTVRRKLRALEHHHYVNVTRMGREMIAVNLVPSVEPVLHQVLKV
jgi:predicted transcriptional regulator